MNRKAIIYIVTSLLVLLMSWEAQKVTTIAAADQLTIPEEAVRLRILANSDSPKDQWLKREIRDKVNEEITGWVSDLTSIEEARAEIATNIGQLEQIVQRELERIGINDSFTVEYGEVQFPTKLYGNIVYPAGHYEAVLITIGEGAGENWWCVLFPPLCFIDFANGDAVQDGHENSESDEIEVRFFVVDLFQQIVQQAKAIFV